VGGRMTTIERHQQSDQDHHLTIRMILLGLVKDPLLVVFFRSARCPCSRQSRGYPSPRVRGGGRYPVREGVG
jgi:hypothetical protein